MDEHQLFDNVTRWLNHEGYEYSKYNVEKLFHVKKEETLFLKKIKILLLIIKVKLKTNFNISFKLTTFYSRWEVITDSIDDSIEFHNCNKATFKNNVSN